MMSQERVLQDLAKEWDEILRHVRERTMTARSGNSAGWLDAIEVMSSEWEALLDAEQGQLTDVRPQQVATWLAALEAIRDEYHALRQAGRWTSGPTDLLSIIGRSRWETYHSALLAWLLDPNMQHGLGTRFLEALVSRCFPDEAFGTLSDAWSQCEVQCGGGQVDIVVWSSALTLVIENKVDALETLGQCDIYFAAFGEEPDARFVFLTPSGSRPQTATGDAAQAFRTLSYRAVKEDLQTVLAETAELPPAPARDVALQYLRTLEREFA